MIVPRIFIAPEKQRLVPSKAKTTEHIQNG